MVINYVVTIVLVLLSGLFSGLTLGLMSLNPFELKRKIKLGNRHAEKIYHLRKRGNLLLCTLLVGNVAVNTALSIFLGSISSGLIAGLIATVLIVIFGEIVPQAYTSRNALMVGANTTWIVYIFLVLLYPVTKPIAYILDKSLGDELPTIYSKKEFRLLLKDQKKLCGAKSEDFEIAEKSLIFSDKLVRNVMTPRTKTLFLKKNSILNPTNLSKIKNSGHSRIPVIGKSKDNIIGILYAKDVIGLDPYEEIKVKDIMRKKVYYIKETEKLNKALKKFLKLKTHLFVVKGKFNGTSGILTLEDVIEEIVGEIVDEYDYVVDMRKL